MEQNVRFWELLSISSGIRSEDLRDSAFPKPALEDMEKIISSTCGLKCPEMIILSRNDQESQILLKWGNPSSYVQSRISLLHHSRLLQWISISVEHLISD